MFNDKTVINLDSETRLEVHVELDDVKHNLHLGNDENDDNAQIEALIESASTAAQKYTDHYFALTELEYSVYNFNSDRIKMHVSPFCSLESIETSDDGTTWTDISADVQVEIRESDFTIHFNDNVDTDYLRFKARVGYDIGSLPEDAKRAIIIKASDFYDTERSSYVMKEKYMALFETLLGSYYNRRW